MNNRTDRYFCTWPECGRSYGKPSKLAEHYRSHTNDRCFVCDFEGCGKSFLRKSHLQRHISTSHLKERPFKCSQPNCSAAFALKHHLTRHEKLHFDAKPFACSWESCGESFAKHEQLRRHVCLAHTGEDFYRCGQCELGFQSKSEFKRHEKTAHSSRVYLCGIEGCGASFPKWSQVVKHRREGHPLPQPQPNQQIYCEECGRGPFKSEASLRQHCRIHTQTPPVKQHSCPQCEKEFVSRSSLKAHLIAVHSTDLPFECEECGKAYGYKKLLKRHIEKRHRAKATTEEEDEEKGESGPSSIIKDASLFFSKERNITCPVKECKRRFFRQYDLDRHLQSMHN